MAMKFKIGSQAPSQNQIESERNLQRLKIIMGAIFTGLAVMDFISWHYTTLFWDFVIGGFAFISLVVVPDSKLKRLAYIGKGSEALKELVELFKLDDKALQDYRKDVVGQARDFTVEEYDMLLQRYNRVISEREYQYLQSMLKDPEQANDKN